jgi:alkanesulfonate monooxygenase SsuD/methylene tetrahydromethanopterin reductase-like flavin-dependent oxidoreductase (luciferase family)
MAQMGVRPASPLTALQEVLEAVRALLRGDTVTVDGRYVHLHDVRLDQPPADPPPVLAGVRGPKSLQVAGRSADGILLAEPGHPSYVLWALAQAGAPDAFHVAVYATLCVEADRSSAYRAMAPWLASALDSPTRGLETLPFFTDLAERYHRHGLDGLVSMPPEWWAEIGPIGTLDDAVAHIEALEAAGVHSIGLFPAPDVDVATAQVEDVVRLATR